MITIVLAEDHHIVRQGLRLILEAEPSFRLVGEASDGLEALQLVGTTAPNVLVTDLMMPRLNGLEVTRAVCRDHASTRVVILSSHADEPYVVEALRVGASAYVLKDSTAADLVKAVNEVMGGRRYLSPILADRAYTGYVQRPGESTLDAHDTLTQRERMVLQLAAEGSSSAEIALKLYISPRTAETHRANLMRKLDLRSQTDLVRFAIRKGIIQP